MSCVSASAGTNQIIHSEGLFMQQQLSITVDVWSVCSDVVVDSNINRAHSVSITGVVVTVAT